MPTRLLVPLAILSLSALGCARHRAATSSSRTTANRPAETNPVILASGAQNEQESPARGHEADPYAPPPTDEPQSDNERSPSSATAPPTQLADLEQLALVHNPTIAQADLAVDAARGLRTQAGLYPNPSIGYMGQDIGAAGTAGMQGGFVMQDFVTGGKLRLARAAANESVHQAAAQRDAQRRRVLGDVRIRYYETLAARRHTTLAEELLQVAEQAQSAAEQSLRVGESALSDVLLARTELEQARVALTSARNDHTSAQRRLAAVVGQPDLDVTQLHDALEEAVERHDWEELWQQVLRESPELQAAAAGVQRARWTLRRAEAEPIPNLNTQFGVMNDASSDEVMAQVQLGIALPVFNRNQGAIRAAHAELHRAEQDVRRLELSLRERLAEAFAEFETAAAQVERYREQILPDARLAVQSTLEGLRAGQFSFTEVLVAQRTYFQASRTFVDALLDLQRSRTAITNLLLSGSLGPSDASMTR